MVGGETHWLDVSLGKEISHNFCTTCFKGSMGEDMATIVDHLFLYEVGHMIVWEELLYELPSWKVIHFIWMVAWRREFFIDDEIPHDYRHFYLEEAIDQQEGFHIDLPFLHGESHLVYPPKANLHIWEELLGDRIVAKYSKQWWRLLEVEAPRGGGEILQHPFKFLRTSNLWEGKNVILINYHADNRNINFSFNIWLDE